MQNKKLDGAGNVYLNHENCMLNVLTELVAGKGIGPSKMTKMWKKTSFWIFFPIDIHDFFTHKKSEVPKEMVRIPAAGISICSQH